MHQPRHEIYKTFDKLVILDHHIQGEMVYSGPADCAPDFFLAIHVHNRQATMATNKEFEQLVESLQSPAIQGRKTYQAQGVDKPDFVRTLSSRSMTALPQGHESRPTKDFIEPSHFLIDAITFAHNKEFVEDAKRHDRPSPDSTQYSVHVGLKLFDYNGAPNLAQAFRKSGFWTELESELDLARSYGNMEPMSPTQASSENMISRALISSSRWYLDLWRDRRAFFIQLGLGWIVALVLGSCFYELGDEMINIDYPTNKAAIMYSIAAMIIALNQFPIAQYVRFPVMAILLSVVELISMVLILTAVS